MEFASTRRQLLTLGTVTLGALGLRPIAGRSAETEEISRTAESIHQEPRFTADCARVYRALLNAHQFDQVVQLSGATQQMHLPARSSRIDPHPGAAFALFGGYVTGRQIVLTPHELIVQAWRAGSWPPGVYSIARFELTSSDSGCRILFDHTGFPRGEAESLASGWHVHYWEPLQKLLSQERD